MFTRVIQQKRPRWSAFLIMCSALVAAGLFAAVAIAYVDGTATLPDDVCDVQVPTKTTSLTCITDAGARVTYIGDSDASLGSSGTGLFDPFVRLQGSPTERGYNTDAAVEFDTKAGKWTHAIQVSGIPVVDCDGNLATAGSCWELFVDINEGNNAKHISLNEVEIYFTGDPELAAYPFAVPSEATLQYDFTGSILINDVNQGSGRGDLRYLIPIGSGTDIAIPAGCDYGNASCETWFVLYSQWGAASGTYASDGGFEEWKVKIYPIPTTAATQLRNTNGANPDTDIADGASVSIGTVVYDTATLGGGVTSDAGGTVSYYYQLQLASDVTPNCSSGTLIGSAVTVTNGVVPASSNVTLSGAGTYEFWAVYSGDPPDNNAATSACGSETVAVGRNSPSATTAQSLIPNDTFTLSGATSDAGGTVDFYLFPPGQTCSLANVANAAFTQLDVALTGNVSASTSNTGSGAGMYLATAEGTYRWLVIYEGDANNNSTTSNCVESFTLDN